MGKHVLSLEKDIEVEKREWPVLRLGWVIMGLVVFAGAFGLFGEGRLSHASLKRNGVSVSFDRFLRYSLSSQIVIESDKLNSDSSIVINSSYVNKVKIEEVTPEPASVKLEGDKIRFKFNSANSKNIVLYVKPVGKGSHHLQLEVHDIKINVDQYIFF